jgi:hypothetical protein
MIDCTELATIVEMHAPASAKAIAQAQAVIGCTFPHAYIDLLTCSDGFFVPPVLMVYETSGIPERNTTYEVDLCLPGWLLIGDDSGGRGIFLDCTDQVGTIYIEHLGSMFRSEARVLASHIPEWMARRFSLNPLS